jgi:hypothetical protein
LNQPLCHPRHADRCTKSESEPIRGADSQLVPVDVMITLGINIVVAVLGYQPIMAWRLLGG